MSDGMIIRSRFQNYLDSKEGAGLYVLQLVTLLGYDSWVLKYSHLKSSFVSPGQQIKRGDAIAESGMSGNCLSPYLHIDLMSLHRQWKPIPIEN
jgi:murein DD-endopeptidase MepM/ murein hydrolase activator NlpD